MNDQEMQEASIEEISERLQTIAEPKFLAAVQTLSAGAVKPEVEWLMAEVRPRRRTLRPPRASPLKRLLCRPFEDLLHSGASESENGIPRTAIADLWPLVTSQDPIGMQGLNAKLRTIFPTDARGIQALGAQLWRRAAKSLGQISATDEAARHLRAMRDALAAADVIEAFKQAVPIKPLPRIGESERNVILETLRKLAADSLPANGFLLVVAARLQSPGNLLEALRDSEAGVPKAAIQGLGTFAIARIEDRAIRFEKTISTARPEDLAREAERLIGDLATTHDALDAKGRSELERRTEGVSAVVRTMLGERIIDAAPAAIAAALPGPDGEPSKENLLAAEAHARAFSRSRRIAGLLGLERQATTVAAAIRKRFEARVDELRQQARAAPEQNAAAQAGIYQSVRMVELAVGAREAAQLLRTARPGPAAP